MFDWFRKKKKNDPEAQAPETQAPETETPEIQAPQAEAEPEAPAPDEKPETPPEMPPEPLPAEETTVVSEDQAPEILPEPLPPAGETAPKKGLFARFRQKFSAVETPEPEARPEGEAGSLEPEPEPEPETEPGADQSENFPEPSLTVEAAPAVEPETGPGPDEPTAGETGSEPAEEAIPPEEEAAASAESAAGAAPESPGEEMEEDEEEEPPRGLFSRFKERLSATRNRLAGRIETLLSSVRAIDEDLLDELEELLITADLGARTTGDLLFKIRGQVAKKELSDAAALKEALKKRILEMVDLPVPPRPPASPLVIMVVGINGVGKTTTIAKLARRLKEDQGQKVLLAAGDTFRSAAVEQLTIWAERLGVDIVAQPTGADSSAVVFDALTAARARQADVVIIDTAGRLHTKVNLMDELKKIRRVAGKAMPGAPHHTILVLDGNTGQNAMRQAQTFHEAVGVDSIIVTKLDGTAKGGVIVSIANELKIPIAFVGLGESFDDLQPFDARAFTEAILGS